MLPRFLITRGTVILVIKLSIRSLNVLPAQTVAIGRGMYTYKPDSLVPRLSTIRSGQWKAWERG